MNKPTKPAIIPLTDFTPVDKKHAGICRRLQEKISGGHSIITINGDRKSGDDLCVFKELGGGYWTQGYVGVISDGANQIVIRSRFDRDDRQFFLQYIFTEAFNNDGRVFEDMGLNGESEAIWDWNILLMLLFLNQLKTAVRKGLVRKYEQSFHNDSRVKGAIDIGRHIKENPFSNGRIAYKTKENTIDNFYNILYLRVFEKMKKKYPAAVKCLLTGERDLRNTLMSLRSSIPNWNTVTDQTILNNTRKRITNTVYRCCEDLRVTSRMLLGGIGVNIYTENKTKVSGVLIDMTKLWEVFLHKTILQRMEAQPEKTILTGKRTIRPDFYWKGKGLVIDAKYKPIWGETLKWKRWRDQDKYDRVREDVFQVMSYMLALDCTRGGLIFPVENTAENQTRHQHGEEPVYAEQLSVYASDIAMDMHEKKYLFRLPYYIPFYDAGENAMKYIDFKKEMKARGDELAAFLEEKSPE